MKYIFVSLAVHNANDCLAELLLSLLIQAKNSVEIKTLMNNVKGTAVASISKMIVTTGKAANVTAANAI